MTCRRSPCTFSSRVIGRSSQSGPLQGVVTLGTIGQMALTLSGHKCQHYSDSVQSRPRLTGPLWRDFFFVTLACEVIATLECDVHSNCWSGLHAIPSSERRLTVR